MRVCVVVMGRGSSDPAGADSLNQIAQNPVIQDTETRSDSGNAGRNYDAIGMYIDDQAAAAYVAASANGDRGDRPNGLLWITRALELTPGERSILELRNALQRVREP